MGLDGGTYITRSDVLRGQSWELSQADTSHSTRGGSIGASHVHKKRRLDTHSEQVTRWTTCSLSGEPLAPPVVADFLGTLYNKSAVLEFLLAKSGVFNDEMQVHKYINQLRQGRDAFEHLKSSRDVFEVQLTLANIAAATQNLDVESAYKCPITDLPCERYPFCAFASCGHVFSERARREMTNGVCHLCDKPFAVDDVIPVNCTAEKREELLAALITRKKNRKLSRRGKKEDANENS